jgi:uncharacterized membrane protein YqaE (UPF0057 family)
MGTFEFNVVLNNIQKKINIDYSCETQLVKELRGRIIAEFKLNKTNADLMLLTKTPTTKSLTGDVIKKLNTHYLEIEVLIKQKGGFGIAMFGIIIMPLIIIGIAFSRGGDILMDFLEILANTFEIIPLIFDPPKLIDDILFAITSSLNMVFKKMTSDVKNLVSSPEDDTLEKGPFGVSNENMNAFSCMDPSWSTIMLLIICPPLAIIYKLGFGAGFISSIICGVLCVKLFYFPGLLFAILHVLC